MNTEERYWLWLCSAPLYYGGIRRLLEYFGSPEQIYREKNRKIQEKKDEWGTAFAAYCRRETLETSIHKIEEKGIHFTSKASKAFPRRLKQIPDPPFGLFYRGRLPDQDRPSVGIVGARACSAYGKTVAAQLGEAFAEAGIQVISGMAEGIDGISQQAALRAGEGFSTAAVLGCGVDWCYPDIHFRLYEELCARGGVIAEYPCGTRPNKFHFPQRNRIISGLSDAVIVVEARKKSGSLITAECALEQGKEVYAVPGRIGDKCSEGCNALIADGAGIILSAKAAPGLIFPNPDHFSLAPEEKVLYSCVDLHPQSLQSLVEKSGLSVQEAGRALFSLEEKGMVAERCGSYYRIK